MYDSIKTAVGPLQNKTAPLKSITSEVITDKGKHMERWVEHYSDLYFRQNVATTQLRSLERNSEGSSCEKDEKLEGDNISRSLFTTNVQPEELTRRQDDVTQRSPLHKNCELD